MRLNKSYTLVLSSVVLILSGCATKQSVPFVIGDSELETPVYVCPVGTVCQIDTSRAAYSKGYMLKIMKTFNRCIEQAQR